jgi:hypothetical protein
LNFDFADLKVGSAPKEGERRRFGNPVPLDSTAGKLVKKYLNPSWNEDPGVENAGLVSTIPPG